MGVMEVTKSAVKRLIRDEKGQALILALILLAIGGLIITPLLGLMTTGLLTGQVYENKMHELYAADAGVEDAQQQLLSNNWSSNYTLSEPINKKQVDVTIDAVWLLEDPSGDLPVSLDLPNTQPSKSDPRYGNDDWTVTGAISIENNATYIIDITAADDPNLKNDKVGHIGVWLPPGYSYVSGSTKINGVAIGENNTLVTDPTPPEGIPHKSGTVLVWNFDENFETVSNITQAAQGGCTPAEKFPLNLRLSFDYAAVGNGYVAKGFFPWMKLDDADRHFAWDTEVGIFHITSRAASNLTPETGTTVETYTLRDFGRYAAGTGGAASALQGDYIAIGNTLMTSCWGSNCSDNCSWECRNYMVSESSAKVNVDAVPPDARIEKAYLYWSAWWETNGADKDVTLAVTRDGTGGNTSVTASRWYVMEDAPSNGYEYACFADVTNQVKDITTEVSGTTFTVSDVNAVAAYACSSVLANQSSYAGWSMIIIYSSKQKEARLFYLYDDLAYLWNAYAEFTITGFEAPQDDNEAKLTVFAGEGDNWLQRDSLQFKGQSSSQYEDLYDVSNTTSVFNSMSNTEGFTASQIAGQPSDQISGVDIDTYTSTRPDGGTTLSSIVQPGDTTAMIKASSIKSGNANGDGFMLIYVIFSIRRVGV
jgi:hypothetical protein